MKLVQSFIASLRGALWPNDIYEEARAFTLPGKEMRVCWPTVCIAIAFSFCRFCITSLGVGTLIARSHEANELALLAGEFPRVLVCETFREISILSNAL